MDNRIFNINNSENKENRGEESPRKNKFDFAKYKNNTKQSLKDVECFLNDCTRFVKCIKLYKLLK